MIEGFGSYETLESPCVQAHGTENVRERGENFSCGWYLFSDDRVQDNSRETIVLEGGELRGLVENEHSGYLSGCIGGRKIEHLFQDGQRMYVTI